jgi:hypothetical protein
VRSAALARGPLGDAALGGELALQLGAADRGLALLGLLAALVDEPRRAPLVLLRLRAGAVGVAAGAVGLLARGVGPGDRGLGLVDRAADAVLGLDRALGLGDERSRRLRSASTRSPPPDATRRSSRACPTTRGRRW